MAWDRALALEELGETARAREAYAALAADPSADHAGAALERVR